MRRLLVLFLALSLWAQNPVVRNPTSVNDLSTLVGPGLYYSGTSPNQKFATNYNGIDALAYCNTPGSPDASCVVNAIATGIANTVVVRNGISLNGVITVPSGMHILQLPGIYPGGNSLNIVLNGNNASWTCTGGPDQTVITIQQTYTSTSPLFTLTGWNGDVNQPGSLIEGCQVSYSQPETSVRTSMVHYPVTFSGSPRVKILHTKISQAWNGLDFSSSLGGGGAVVDDLEISSFNTAINIDNTGDLMHFSNLHVWPFGFPVDSNKLLAYKDANNFGLMSGRCDGLLISNSIFYIGTSIRLFTGTGSTPGPTFGILSAVDLDTFNGISMSAGSLAIGGGEITVGNSTSTGIAISGGSISISAVNIGANGGNQLVAMTGGEIQIGDSKITVPTMASTPFLINNGGADFRLSNSTINLASPTQTIFSNTAGRMSISGNNFITVSNVVFINPLILFNGSGARGDIHDNLVSDLGTGSGTLVQVTMDSWIQIHDHNMLGWTLNLPGSYTEIRTHDNCQNSTSCI